jgi:tight adherence protein B
MAQAVFFILLYTALLSIFGQNLLTVLRESRLFRHSAQKRRRSAEDRAIRKDSAWGRYRMKLAAIQKNSRFEADVEGLLRIKAVLGAMGLAVGAVMQNPPLAIVLLVGLYWLPDAYFRIYTVRYAKAVDETIEGAMSIITNSYLQSEDIKSAILENIARVGQPLKSVMREFLAETGFVDASVPKAIMRMKMKVDNAYFGDWCDILLQCQDDRELKYVLPSVVTKLSNVKRIQADLDAAMMDIYKEFVYVVGIVVLNLPLMPLLNAEWAEILFREPIGKAAVTLCFTVIFASTGYVVSVNRALSKM